MDQGLFSPDARAPLSAWCDCPDAPARATGAATLLDHPGGCEFPAGICTVREHRVTTHKSCGRPIRMRFCGCIPSGYTFDHARGWWVHYVCGWPTRYSMRNLAIKPAGLGLFAVLTASTVSRFSPGFKREVISREATRV